MSDNKLDKAYENMQTHIAGYNTFEEFEKYFWMIVKTDDKDHIIKWLLKVLFKDMKDKSLFQTEPSELEKKFSELISLSNQITKDNLMDWVDTQLAKHKG